MIKTSDEPTPLHPEDSLSALVEEILIPARDTVATGRLLEEAMRKLTPPATVIYFNRKHVGGGRLALLDNLTTAIARLCVLTKSSKPTYEDLKEAIETVFNALISVYRYDINQADTPRRSGIQSNPHDELESVRLLEELWGYYLPDSPPVSKG